MNTEDRPDCVSMDKVPPNETSFDDRGDVPESVYYMRAIKHREGMIGYYTEQLQRAQKYRHKWGSEIPSIMTYLQLTEADLKKYQRLYDQALVRET